MSIVPKSPYEPITAVMLRALEEKWPNGELLATAFRLGPDAETCADLVAGRHVSEDRLDQSALFEARRRSLVQLSAPVELVNVDKAAA